MFARPSGPDQSVPFRRPRVALLTLLWLAPGCSEFEPPLPAHDAAVGPMPTADTGLLPPHDAGTDAGTDGATGGDIDAATHDAGLDARVGLPDAASVDAGGSDAAAVDAAVVIPTRPNLPKCGFLAPVVSGTVTTAGLNEISGIAVSRKNARVLWLVEDSGNGGQLHAINDLGALIATYSIGGSALDMEDLAVGPGPMADVSYLYIGDIGDNNGMRASITVYRAPEPNVIWNQAPITAALPMLEPLPMKYPSGDLNAEALFVDPVTQDIYIITKDGFTRPNTLYRMAAPQQPATPRILEPLAAVYGGTGIDVSVTAADMSADGKRIIVRSLHAATHYTRADGVSVADTMLTGVACDAELAVENKGESISFSATGYYTVSEGTSVPLNFVALNQSAN